MTVFCYDCRRSLSPGEALIFHSSHQRFMWLCEVHWREWQKQWSLGLRFDHESAMARARAAAVIPRATS
jgi:hypothetical protein